MKHLTYLFIAFIFFLGCSQREEPLNFECEKQLSQELYDMESSERASDEMSSSKPKSAIEESLEIPTAEKIIKTADIRMEVKNYEESKINIQSIVKKWKVYISEERETNDNYSISNTFVIRVASESFDTLINEIVKEAKRLDYKNINATDVTEEFVDIESRLKTKKEFEARYLELLKQAKNIKEILEVENQLRVIREEIEAKEGRLKYLNNKVSYSTINLTIYQYHEYKYVGTRRGFGNMLLKAFEGGWKGIQYFILALGYLWPILIVLVILFYFLRRHRRRKRKLQ